MTPTVTFPSSALACKSISHRWSSCSSFHRANIIHSPNKRLSHAYTYETKAHYSLSLCTAIITYILLCSFFSFSYRQHHCPRRAKCWSFWWSQILYPTSRRSQYAPLSHHVGGFMWPLAYHQHHWRAISHRSILQSQRKLESWSKLAQCLDRYKLDTINHVYCVSLSVFVEQQSWV